MTIPASHIVSVSPRVISGGSADLETNGMVLTKSALLPSSQPAMEFSSASAVSALFGAESDEAIFAQQYFTGVNNSQKSINTLVIGRYVAADAPAWVRGAELESSLAALKAVTDGTLTLIISGATVTGSGIDLSAATSLSEAASIIADKIDGVTGSYDSNTNTFTFTTVAVGKDATIDLPEAVGGATVGSAIVGTSTVAIEGTDLASMLGLTVDQGAVLSQGADAQTQTEALEAVGAVTRNWVGFTTLWEASADEAEGFSAWADIDDDYVYVDWTTDEKVTNTLTQAGTKPAFLMGKEFNCTVCVYGNYDFAAFVLAVGASIDWQREQGIKAWFAKSSSGLTPLVSDETQADALEAVRCSYYGIFATRNSRFTFMNTGALTSDYYGFIDTLYGSIWLRNAIQRSCMDGFTSINRAPYNAVGHAFISAWLQDPIETGLRNGVIDTGLELSQSQKTQILQEVGTDISNSLYTNGYWYSVAMPDANVRVQRGSPIVSVYYGYAGSVQRLEIPVTAVL